MANNECPIWNTLAEQIRSEPTKAIILAFGAGLLLRFLPVGKLLGFLVKMTFVLSKPVLLILGIIKLLEYYGVTGD
jgi:hypothetical protein